jgi:Tol biopolymer transport system component
MKCQLLVLTALCLPMAASPAFGTTLLPLTLTEDPLIWGAQANQNAEACAISGNGLVSAFESAASQLVAADRNGYRDIFVQAGANLTRISRRADLSESRGDSTGVALSSTGRYVSFISRDDLLNLGDSAGTRSFHLDRQTATLQRVAVDRLGNSVDVTGPMAISGNGRYVVFTSGASNIVMGDNNNRSDVFRFDVLTGTTVAVSVTAAGVFGNETSNSPSVDDSGNVVAFVSLSTNFIAGDTTVQDVYVKDLTSGAIVRASQTTAGIGGSRSSFDPSLSANGNFVVFATISALDSATVDSNNFTDIYRHAVLTGVTERVSVSTTAVNADGPSALPSVSANGRFVWFQSTATNLVMPGANVAPQIYRRDMNALAVIRVTNGAGSAQNVASSADGQRACFQTNAPLELGDTNQNGDIYLVEPATSTLFRQSIADSVVPTLFGANGSALGDVSADLSRVFSISGARDLDRESFADFPAAPGSSQLLEIQPANGEIKALARVGGNLPNGVVDSARVSSDGNWVVFESFASNLVPGDVNGLRDTFRLNLTTGAINAVSVDSAGTLLGSSVPFSEPNSNGARVAFASSAETLVAGDTNGHTDVFLWDAAAAPAVRRVSVGASGAQANSFSGEPSIDDGGNRIAFKSNASNLVTGDTNGEEDIFLHIVSTGVTTRVSLDSNGAQLPERSTAPRISSDGRYIAYAYRNEEIYLYDVLLQTRTRITPPAGISVLGESVRFGRDPRYLSYIGRGGGGGGDIAYRYDRFALDKNFELLRLLGNDPYRPPFIADARIASAKHAVIDTNARLSDADRNGTTDLLLVSLETGAVTLAGGTLSVAEDVGTIDIPVTRSGGSEGFVNVSSTFTLVSAQAADVRILENNALWQDGVSGIQNLRLEIVDDALQEPAETLLVTLFNPGGGVALGSVTTLNVQIIDNEALDLLFKNGFDN